MTAPIIFVARILETKSCWALIVTAYSVPTLIWIALILLAITLPISTNALLDPRNSASTVSEDMYPWIPVIYCAESEEIATVL